MEYKIFLDSRKDIPEEIQEEWIVVGQVRHFEQLVTTNYLENEVFPETVSFTFNLGFDVLDHKINPKVETGLDAFRWLVEFCKNYNLKLPECLVHAEGQHGQDLKTIIKNTKSMYNL